MDKFLKWFTRSKEEAFFGILLMIGMAAVALNAHGFGHPIHIEVDHDAMEREYVYFCNEYYKANEEREVQEKMLRHEKEMKECYRQHEEMMREYDRKEREMEQDMRWQEREDSRLKNLVRSSRDKCYIPEID